MKKCPIFGEAIQKFGWENMEQNILRLCLTKEEADYWERYYIKEKNSLYPNGYNLQDGGQSAHAHDYTKKRMSESQTGRKHTPEELMKMSESNKGKHLFTDEMRRKSRETHLNADYISKGVRKLSIDGQILGEYPSISEACRQMELVPNKCVSAISACCKGKSNTAFGYRWEYI